jgi:glycosyltransferase involved in cell wall biosynthesis
VTELPRISIVMPVWNAESFLRAAIESILAQSFADFELVAVDDGSTDSSMEILQSYNDVRVRVIRQEHLGFVEALARGIEEAKAAWIARHDADDISHAERLQKQWDAVQRAGAILCYCDFEMIGDTNKAQSHPHFPRTRALLALKGCFQCPVIVGAALINRSIFLAADGYRASEFPAEDYGFFGRSLFLGNVTGVPERLYQVRVHPGQISKTKSEAQVSMTQHLALQHCERFMRLTPRDAQRAFAVLSGRRGGKDWAWLLWRCIPRLRWKSLELYGWLVSQTVRRLVMKS